ncbi:putative extracellular soluble lytic transglycosylase [Pseudovirgaria hyperparasitica]|uniref:Putative extracellular soluble lytic transglycosylase n=1 Tax=Pseudovirgaria hyperparasitica TaxID=470096 RepID=A0A6A6WD22_9PEZI|nr:putative extracellular soluble lytic transglycosylase [Pseudovirgaria hyperparasitica]KAF2759467.1 putative extracellular soluble lytic transglycosylase [Pseudovirgaria hyperparasitica]
MDLKNTIKVFCLAGLLSVITQAQSVNPGVGINPNAHGATENVTPSSGPNGAIKWLNSGMDQDSGWKPPFLDFDTIKHISKEQFYDGPGSACRKYDWAFSAAADEFNIDAAILAMIAQQESSCNADAGGSTPGLMQVACGNYPGGVCHPKDIKLNVRMGAKYFRDRLDESDNNVLKALGNYNGWFTGGSGRNGNKGLTKSYPCSNEGKSNGDPQNLDYLHQQVNGWFMGLNPYGDESWIGTNRCSGSCKDGKAC